MSDAGVPPMGGGWAAGLLGFGMLPGVLGVLKKQSGQDAKRKTRDGACEFQERILLQLLSDLDSMSHSAECLVGTEGEATCSPFNEVTNKFMADRARLRRRVLLALSKLQPVTLQKTLEDMVKIAREVEEAERGVVEALAMPEVPPAPTEAPPQAPTSS